MRDFNFKDDANPSAADFTEIRPQETTPEILKLDDRLDETPREDSSSLRSFHAEPDEESNNLPKIAGAVLVGLLIVGSGLYAYETSFAHRAPVKTVAMNTAPTNTMAASAPAATPDTSAAPSPTPAAPVKSATETPAPLKTEPVLRSASSTPSNAPGVGIGPTNDPAINAPMTLTPDTAPPAEQSGPASQTAGITPPAQTAMQQPITAPDVGNSSQPTASVAANQASGVTVPSDTSSASAPAQMTQQPAQLQPAQIQPARIQPTQPVQ